MINTSLFKEKWKQVPDDTTYGHAWSFCISPFDFGHRFEWTGTFAEACEKAEAYWHHPWNPIYLMP